MKIALIGYGKMGKAIEEIALQRGHTIALAVDLHNAESFTQESMAEADVAIEFTGPGSAYDNILKCLQYKVPVVSGSTGWLEKWDNVIGYCTGHDVFVCKQFQCGGKHLFRGQQAPGCPDGRSAGI